MRNSLRYLMGHTSAVDQPLPQHALGRVAPSSSEVGKAGLPLLIGRQVAGNQKNVVELTTRGLLPPGQLQRTRKAAMPCAERPFRSLGSLSKPAACPFAWVQGGQHGSRSIRSQSVSSADNRLDTGFQQNGGVK
jgi:hypothetical protein